MIVISSIAFDETTSEVMDWLNKLKLKVLRINNDRLNISCFEGLLPFSVSYQSKIKALWFRKSGLSFIPKDSSIVIEQDITDYSINELAYLKAGIFTTIDCYKLGPADSYVLNKMNILKKLYENGLKIPPTLVTTNKEMLVEFIEKHGEVIVKPIGDGQSFHIKNSYYRLYTESVNDFVDELMPNFFPALFQKYIDKKYEIRSLYLDGEIHSMAIFSQTNLKTRTDFRRYDIINPNRKNAFKLPTQIGAKMTKVMKALNLNMGVFDIIKDQNNDYVFLEVNPWGQFGDISKNCNYYIERSIAEKLSQNNCHERRI